MRNHGICLMAAAGLVCGASMAQAQLRVVAWNISNYSGGRGTDLQNAIYSSFQGRSMSPDVITAMEFTTASALSGFVTILNTAPGSPGDWAAAPFVDGADTESILVYRTSKVTLLNNRTVTVAVGSSDTNNQPRNTYRWDLRLKNYGTASSTLAVYGVHLKAGSASSDNARRLVETTRIRDNAEGVDTNGAGTGMPAGQMFLIGGDMNVQNATQTAYVQLIGSQVNNTGRFFDPISTPGTWNNNSAFRFVHTQDPANQMDDRHDQILVCGGLVDGAGFDYIGNFGTPYSTTTWNDPNHSYRCWGNDGSTFDLPLATTGNAMVGPSIGQSLINIATAAGGHLPVMLDFRVPAKVTAPVSIDLGDVAVGTPAGSLFAVGNGGDTALWTTAGIATLHYSMVATAGFTVPGAAFTDAPGGSLNQHQLTADTSTVGLKTGTITISTDDPDRPTVLVSVRVNVVAGACPGDFNGDGFLDGFDYDDFVTCFEGTPPADCPPGKTNDFNGDGFVDGFDYDDFLAAFEVGC